jgi:hypothetical protein
LRFDASGSEPRRAGFAGAADAPVRPRGAAALPALKCAKGACVYPGSGGIFIARIIGNSRKLTRIPEKDRPAGLTNMYYTVIDARYVRDFTIWAKFADGSEGEINLADALSGPVFEPLKDVNYFRNFSLAEYGTICWPNGADIAPEFLYEKVRVHA